MDTHIVFRLSVDVYPGGFLAKNIDSSGKNYTLKKVYEKRKRGDIRGSLV
jgi:hypothetical protein